jgi:hypothetical protein
MMKHSTHRSQSGLSVVVVLLLMSVMVVGAMSLARMSEIGTLASGNMANKDGSLLASEAGLTAAFNAVKKLTDVEATANIGGWYFATQQPVNPANGLPQVNFSGAAGFKVDDRYTVRYVVDRQCAINDVPHDEVLRFCLVRHAREENRSSRASDDPALRHAPTIQYRVTVRVTDPKGSQTWVQSLVTRGSGV